MENPKMLMTGKVTTYISGNGALVISNPEPGTDWDHLEELPHDEALIELLEYQLANGFDVIRPKEIAALTDALIIGWDVNRDNQGVYQDAGAIFWHEDYQVQNAIKELKKGNAVIFPRGDQRDLKDLGKYRA